MEFDQTVDFSKYKTFAIRDGELNSKNPALDSNLVKKQIDSDIERALEARGLRCMASSVEGGRAPERGRPCRSVTTRSSGVIIPLLRQVGVVSTREASRRTEMLPSVAGAKWRA